MNDPHEIDLAYQGLPEDRRMANDPRSTPENNEPAKGANIVDTPRGGMSAEQLRSLGFEVGEK